MAVSHELNETPQIREKDLSTTQDESQPKLDGKTEKKGSFDDYLRIFKYAEPRDRFLYAISMICAIATGTALPLMTLVFGRSTSSFNDFASGQSSPQQFQDTVNTLALYFVYLFIARFAIGYIGTLCICIAAARTTSSLRKAFLESLLRQSISHFDLRDNGSAATQVTTSRFVMLANLILTSHRWLSYQSRYS